MTDLNMKQLTKEDWKECIVCGGSFTFPSLVISVVDSYMRSDVICECCAATISKEYNSFAEAKKLKYMDLVRHKNFDIEGRIIEVEMPTCGCNEYQMYPPTCTVQLINAAGILSESPITVWDKII